MYMFAMYYVYSLSLSFLTASFLLCKYNRTQHLLLFDHLSHIVPLVSITTSYILRQHSLTTTLNTVLEEILCTVNIHAIIIISHMSHCIQNMKYVRMDISRFSWCQYNVNLSNFINTLLHSDIKTNT